MAKIILMIDDEQAEIGADDANALAVVEAFAERLAGEDVAKGMSLAEKMALRLDCSVSDQGSLTTRIDIPIRTTE